VDSPEAADHDFSLSAAQIPDGFFAASLPLARSIDEYYFINRVVAHVSPNFFASVCCPSFLPAICFAWTYFVLVFATISIKV